jgi:multidrug efflux pump subunit AcrA (membrane-fusion protein)
VSDEDLAVAEISTAPELEATVAPTTEETKPEEQAPEKTFTQKELDMLIERRVRKERQNAAKAAQELAQLQAEMQAKSANPPAPDDFENAQAYAEALAEQKAQQLLARREQERQQAAVLEAYQDREEDARAKYDDFEQVAYNPNLPVTDYMAQAIQASDIGPDVIYHLGSNPKEAHRIANLPPILQAKEIGRIEAKLAADPPTKRTSTAPAPLAPVTATRSSSGPRYDTTDPRSTKSMSTSDWIEAERLRQIKKWEAQNRR